MRRPSRPCSGRGASGSVVSHFGPPTAPSRTASAPRQASEHLVGEGGAVRVDRAAAHQLLVELELAERLEQAPRGARRSPARSRRRAGGRCGGRRSRGRTLCSGRTRLDVEADVVEGQRLAETRPGPLRRTASRRSSGRRSRCGPRLTVRRNASGLGGLDRPWLQPAAGLGEAGGAQPRLGLLGAGEVPVPVIPSR